MRSRRQDLASSPDDLVISGGFQLALWGFSPKDRWVFGMEKKRHEHLDDLFGGTPNDFIGNLHMGHENEK